MRPIYPKTKMPKNCPRLDIKTGASLRCEKVRKNQKRVCSPKEWGFIGPKPPRSILAKYDLKRGCFLLLKTGPKESISSKNCLKGLWLTIKLHDITSSSTFVNDFLPEQVKYLLKKGTNLIEFKFVPNWHFDGTTTCRVSFSLIFQHRVDL